MVGGAEGRGASRGPGPPLYIYYWVIKCRGGFFILKM